MDATASWYHLLHLVGVTSPRVSLQLRLSTKSVVLFDISRSPALRPVLLYEVIDKLIVCVAIT